MFKRFLIDRLKAALEDTPVILLHGARQTGKSTLCHQLIRDGFFQGEFISMDDSTAIESARTNTLSFLSDYGRNLIIDEVQRVPEILLGIKKLVDEDRHGRRFILTGSSGVLTIPRVSDSLAGRLEMLHLWPLSYNEIRDQQPPGFLKWLLSDQLIQPSTSVSWENILEIMSVGGYPESVIRRNPLRRSRWFESYLMAMMQKDIRELSNIEGLSHIPSILKLLSVRIGSTVNFSDISRLAGVKNSTLQRYVSLLEQIFLLVKIPAWTPNMEGQFVKSPKVYLNDTGLLCHLAGEDVESLRGDRRIAGMVFENLIVTEILKQMSWSDEFLQPYHFSMHKGHEVDFVLMNRKNQIYGIEIKAASALTSADFNGLRRLAGFAKVKFKRGIVLYTGEKMVPFGDNMFAVPVSQLWL